MITKKLLLTKELRLLMVLLCSWLVIGCSSTPDDADSESAHDTFEGFNRSMWTLNHDYLDPYLVRPVSLGYVNYVPSPIRSGIANFFSNLDEPSSMVNNLLMGNGERALDHFTRFFLNSTVGILGLFDIASAAGIEKEDNKAFGDALGHYGVGNGAYIMAPGYGPWTVRESADLVDGLYQPLSYLNIWGSISKWVFEGMETRAALASQEAMLDNSPDPYALVRDAYLQRRDFMAEIEDDDEYNEDEEQYLDDYLDGDFEDGDFDF